MKFKGSDTLVLCYFIKNDILVEYLISTLPNDFKKGDL